MTDQDQRILTNLKTGTTEYLILAFIGEQDTYGYEISLKLHERSNGLFELQQGFLYPALKRMVRDGLVESYWRQSEKGGPRCKYYTLTNLGELKLEAFLALWRQFTGEFNRLLKLSCPTPEALSEPSVSESTSAPEVESEIPVLSKA